jgi:hypothetical protein
MLKTSQNDTFLWKRHPENILFFRKKPERLDQLSIPSSPKKPERLDQLEIPSSRTRDLPKLRELQNRLKVSASTRQY